MSNPVFHFNKIYKPVFTTAARYIDCWGGRGSGKSYFGTDYFLFKITQPGYFRGYFVRQAFNDIRDSLFRDFKDRIEDNETLSMDDFAINENEMRIIYKPTGNMIMSKGVKKEGNRTAKMKSLAGATHVLTEETDEIGEEDFDQMDLSLRTVKVEQVQIVRLFNPPAKSHWLWNKYILTESEVPGYFIATPKSDSNICSIFSNYQENIIHLQKSTVEQFESYKARKPEYYYTVVRGLISEGMRGRIFSGWKPITNQEFNDIDARSIFGQDFGSSSPAGTVEAKIVNNRLYLREQNYNPLTEREIGQLYCRLGLKDQVIIADSAEPMTVRKLRAGWELAEFTPTEQEEAKKEGASWKYAQMLKGWNIYGAIKVAGSVQAGIGKMKDFEVFVVDSSDNLWKEYREYKWALDKNKNPTDEPEDANNHLMDAIRYVVTGKGRFY